MIRGDGNLGECLGSLERIKKSEVRNGKSETANNQIEGGSEKGNAEGTKC